MADPAELSVHEKRELFHSKIEEEAHAVQLQAHGGAAAWVQQLRSPRQVPPGVSGGPRSTARHVRLHDSDSEDEFFHSPRRAAATLIGRIPEGGPCVAAIPPPSLRPPSATCSTQTDAALQQVAGSEASTPHPRYSRHYHDHAAAEAFALGPRWAAPEPNGTCPSTPATSTFASTATAPAFPNGGASGLGLPPTALMESLERLGAQSQYHQDLVAAYAKQVRRKAGGQG